MAHCVRALPRRRERLGEAGGRHGVLPGCAEVGMLLTGDNAVLPAFDHAAHRRRRLADVRYDALMHPRTLVDLPLTTSARLAFRRRQSRWADTEPQERSCRCR